MPSITGQITNPKLLLNKRFDDMDLLGEAIGWNLEFRQLIHARSGTRVNDIANLQGFWHMGRFASHYRRQFGELPSQTLNDFS